MSFFEFLSQVTSNPILAVTVLLILGVIFVNGWTDAPNAIATCVSTKAMGPKAAIMMAAVFNFLGVLAMSILSGEIAETIQKMVNFEGNQQHSLVALCAAMFAIVVWATAAWWFGIPTSESHALIAGITGAAIALQGGLDGVNPAEWMKVVKGLVVSTVLGFGMGWIIVKAVILVFRRFDRRKTQGVFQFGQIVGAAAMAFMHGAQDGLKFIGVFMLGTTLVTGGQQGENIHTWLMVLVSLVMGVGTSIGGYRIIKAVGMDMVKMEKYEGFSADLAGAACLLVATVAGFPVSTTHTKTVSIMGVGAAKRISNVNWSVVKEMVMTWILTFPGCGLLGFLMAKSFMWLFTVLG